MISLKKIFRLSLAIKGVNGLLEILGSGLLLFSSSSAINSFVNAITVHELSEDPTDFVAHALISLGQQLGSIRLFGAIYLLVHGLIKIILVFFLVKNNIKIYPWAITILLVLTTYQTYLVFTQPSIALIFLTLIDLVIIALAWHEYLKAKNGANNTLSS